MFCRVFCHVNIKPALKKDHPITKESLWVFLSCSGLEDGLGSCQRDKGVCLEVLSVKQDEAKTKPMCMAGEAKWQAAYRPLQPAQ